MKSSLAIEQINQKVLMTDNECKMISELVYSISGIKLGHKKKIMIQSRLDRRLLELNIYTYSDYLNFVNESDEELEYLINSLTTNKTEFWRESDHFDFLNNVIESEYSLKTCQSPFYVWSAACSTGQEVCTIAILLEEFKKKNSRFDYRVLGTDIDTDILSSAKNCIFKEADISTVPRQYLCYFDRGVDINKGMYRLKGNIRSNIKYRQFNLIKKDSYIGIKFDVIFLRNVLIYFDLEKIQIVIDKLVSQLEVGGYLLIGHSESLNGIKHNLKAISGSIYKKV